MKEYLIERNISGAGKMDDEQLRAVIAKSNQALAKLGPDVQWQQSFVTDDSVFCVYFANDKNLVKKHAEMVGLPADRILEIRRTVDPSVDAAA